MSAHPTSTRLPATRLRFKQTIVRTLAFGLAVLVATLALSCGSDTERSAGIIHRLLLAAEEQDPSSIESFVGRLPDGLPIRPPIYPGADIIVSSRQPASSGPVGTPAPGSDIPEPLLYFIVLDTGDSRDDVFDYYDTALDTEPWQIESSFSSELIDTVQFVNAADADISGVVSIAQGGDDDRTTVLISLQDAGAFREEAPPFEVGESVALPKDFPIEVPIPEGATLTDTAFFREPGSENFLVIFITESPQDNVIDFYRAAFRDLGWTVTDAPSIALETTIDFSDKLENIQGEILADRFSEDRNYTEVRIQIRANPAREPVETPAERTATPEPTEADGGN